MEASLHEIDRARAAYTFGAQLADPRTNPEYWGEWHEFEVAHGNEETFREMLRIKRGVQTAFSTVNYNTADTDISSKADAPLSHEDAIAMLAAQEGEGLEGIENERISGFVKAKRPAEVKDLDEVERRAAKLRKVTASLVASTQARVNDNDEEIDIDD
jgi:pre-mRNA-splicing factor SYF1